MKNLILMELLKQFRNKPNLMKKLKLFAIVGSIAAVFVTGLAIWAGVFFFGLVSDQLKSMNLGKDFASLEQKLPDVSAKDLEQQVQTQLETHVASLPALTSVGCWDQTQKLMAVETWLTKPLAETFSSIKNACFASTEAPKETI